MGGVFYVIFFDVLLFFNIFFGSSRSRLKAQSGAGSACLHGVTIRYGKGPSTLSFSQTQSPQRFSELFKLSVLGTLCVGKTLTQSPQRSQGAQRFQRGISKPPRRGRFGGASSYQESGADHLKVTCPAAFIV